MSRVPPSHQTPSSADMESLVAHAQNTKLERDLFTLQKNYVAKVNDCASAYRTIESLENKIEAEVKPVVIESIPEETKNEIQNLREKIPDFQKVIDRHETTIADLNNMVEAARIAQTTLVKEISILKSKASDTEKIIKAQKKDIYNSEKKNSDLVEQIASLKAGRSDLKKRRPTLLMSSKF